MSRMQPRPLDHLLIALGFGIVTALAEVMVLGVRWAVLHQFVWAGVDVIWMGPLFYVGVFGLFGAAAALGSRIIPRWPLGFTAGVAATAMSVSLIFLLARYRLATVALVLLSAGIGVQVGRLVQRDIAATVRLVRRWLPIAALVVFCVAAGSPGIRAWREHHPGSRNSGGASQAANIVLIILDTVRAASLSLYGYDQPTTPALERWARRGITFDHAVATSSWTLPSHGAMFTGHYPRDLHTGWETPLDARWPVIADAMRYAGYRTAGFVANLQYTARESGLARGFSHYEDYKVSREQFLKSTALGDWVRALRLPYQPSRRGNDRKTGAEVTRQFLTWAAEPDRRPYFAFLNYYDAHDPYLAPQPWRGQFTHTGTRQDRYDASIAYLDHQLDSLLTELERRGELAHTLVVITSDHGELFDYHGLDGHGNSLYDPVLHVPLLFLGPTGAADSGTRVATPVSLRDVPATLLDLAGLPDSLLPGTSLAGAWSAPATWPGSPLFSELQKGIRTPPDEPVSRGDMHSLYAGRLHYILNGDGEVELYDLETDPMETRNLAGAPAWHARQEALDRTLRQLADSSARPQVAP